MDIFKIKGEIKRYTWGTDDYIKSLVGFDKEGIIAEYWLGTHYLGEAKDEEGELLSSRVSHPLSFLLKVLSISSPLAIQCHPSSSQAKEGFIRETELSIPSENRNYSDDNHKTEAAVALSDFTALYGFRPLDDVKSDLESYVPFLSGLVKTCSSVKEIMLTIKNLDDEEKKIVLGQLRKKTEGIVVPPSPILDREEISALFLSLYPSDVWCISPLLMNVINLKPYDSIFIEPGVVHAYCRGNCMEIMTSSDNMTRLGLTRRFVDEDEFMKISSFSEGIKENVKEYIITEGEYSYPYPCPEFSLSRYEGGRHVIPPRRDGILFAIEGEAVINGEGGGIKVKRGEAVYISEKAEATITVEDGVIFFAYEKPQY